MFWTSDLLLKRVYLIPKLKQSITEILWSNIGWNVEWVQSCLSEASIPPQAYEAFHPIAMNISASPPPSTLLSEQCQFGE